MSESPCFVDVRGNSFNFAPLGIALPMGLSYIALMLRYIPSILNDFPLYYGRMLNIDEDFLYIN